MAKLTLLQMTQDILNDMDSDEVNGINDTVESMQVAQIIETTYFEMIANKIWPHLKSFFRLEGLGDTGTPSHMKLPENVKEIDDLVDIRYNVRTATDTKDRYEPIMYKTIEGFIQLTNSRTSSETDVDSVTDTGGASLLIKNDIAPQYWTSFDDEHIVFDSYDSAVDTTLQSSKTQVVGYREPTFDQTDSFIADLPSKVFPMLLAEAKSVCFNALKQVGNQKAEQQASRQRRTMSQESWRTGPQNRFIDYGRRGSKGRAPVLNTNSLFDKD